MNDRWIIMGLAVAAAGLAAITLLLYWFVICITLYWHGARFPTGLMPWRYFRDLRDYREIRAAQGRSVTLYYMMLFLTWTTFAVVLMLGATFWRYYSETSSMHQRPW